MEKQKGIAKIAETYNKLSKTASSLYLLLIIVGAGSLVLYAINRGKATNIPAPTVQSESQDLTALQNCHLTAAADILKPDQSSLSTLFQVSSIDTTQIIKTANGKNDIAPIFEPKFLPIAETTNCYKADDEMVVIKVNDDVRLYPKNILTQHLIIHDQIGAESVIITRCNLCGSYNVYSRKYKDHNKTFGNTGLVYKNSDMIYDYETESLWSIFTGEAIVGTLTGAKLTPRAFSTSIFSEAQTNWPNAKVMTFNTGYRQNYFTDPFAGFAESSTFIGPIANPDQQIEFKARVYTFAYNGGQFAIKNIWNDKYISQAEISGSVKKSGSGFALVLPDGTKLPLRASFWYVWHDYYPDTRVID